MGKRLTVYLTALALLPLAFYVVGYFGAGGRRDYPPFHNGVRVIQRTYSYPWLVQIYKPAGVAESAVRGQPVSINLNEEGLSDDIVRKNARPRP